MRNRRPQRGRGNDRNPRQRTSPRPPKRNIVPTDFAGGVVLLDNDEFYGLYLDLLLGDFQKPELVRVQSSDEFEQFKKNFTQGVYEGNIYLVDELFGWGEVDLSRVVANLRLKDPKAFVIGCTALSDGAIDNPELYDAIAVKSKGNHEQSLAKVLSNHWKIELNYTGAEPEKGYI